MKQLKLYFVLLLFLSINNYAQETEKSNELNDKLKFYFTNGYGAIYQAPITENTFYRIHADVNIDINDGGYDSEDAYSGDRENKYATDGTEKEKSISILVSPEYCFNLINKNYVTVYLGAGPFFSYSHNYVCTESTERLIKASNTSNSSYYPYYTNKKQTTNGYALGVICFAGAESKINDFLSIFAEFDIKASRSWQYIKYEDSRKNSYGNENQFSDDNEKIWIYAFSNVKIGVSIML